MNTRKNHNQQWDQLPTNSLIHNEFVYDFLYFHLSKSVGFDFLLLVLDTDSWTACCWNATSFTATIRNGNTNFNTSHSGRSSRTISVETNDDGKTIRTSTKTSLQNTLGFVSIFQRWFSILATNSWDTTSSSNCWNIEWKSSVGIVNKSEHSNFTNENWTAEKSSCWTCYIAC